MKKTLLAMALTYALSAGAQTVSNSQFTVLPAAVRTAAQVNSSDYANNFYRGVHAIVTVSGYVSGSYTVTIQGKNLATGSYYDLLVGTAIIANGQTVLKLYPGINGVANGAASDFLPQTWRVQLNGAASPNMTIAVDAILAGG
jgi:hypothetical protein